MIRYHNPNQTSIVEFDWPFHSGFDESNRWVILSRCIPWELLADSYNKTLSSNQGRPAKDARLVIGAVIIKHKLCLSDRETVNQIQENPYLQYFVGLAGYQTDVPFVPSLLVEVRKRMGNDVFEEFHQAIIGAVEQAQNPTPSGVDDELPSPDTPSATGLVEKNESTFEPDDNDKPTHQGKLIIDATVAKQAIRYPTGLSLLNEACQSFLGLVLSRFGETTTTESEGSTTYHQTTIATPVAQPGAYRKANGLLGTGHSFAITELVIASLLGHSKPLCSAMTNATR